ELEQRWPPKLEDPSGVGAVIRTRTPEVLGTIPDALVDRTPDPELRAIVKELGLCSSICVPLVARDRTLGAVTLVSAESGRHYGARDVRVAEELARRAAMAIDNAALYADARAALAARDQAVAELQDLTASLERRVAERTALLTESNRELEAFSYTVSHDLRAPIRHVAGFVDLLERSAGGQLDARARHYVATIKGAAQQMGTLIDALLAFSRIGRTDLARRPVDLRPVVLDVVRELQPDLAGRDVRIDVDPDLPTVLGDAIMLRVALTNLLSNAVKYTRGPATARIEVRRAARERPGEAVIRVSDNGIGFNMAYESKLFGVFQRLHNNPAFEGTGIGLATVRRIVTRHGGRVWAASTEGAGATFYVALPEAPSTSIERTESAR
ncbi:MAG TPA: ATP-binding protein, partial [Minicystis sp.]|nr:ATP-binding protein [Minicystis sp.]